MPRAYSDTMRSSKPSRRRSPLGTITGSNVPLRSRGTARFMRDHDVDILTLGQYLQPTRKHVPVAEFLHPDRFSEYEEQSLKLGFRYVAAGPMVRSSYKAAEFFVASILASPRQGGNGADPDARG